MGELTINNSQFIDIRRMINANKVTEAEELLNGTPYSMRDAEWYFLKGSVQHSRGWLEDAYENFSRAAQLNPTNAEYSAALNQMQYQRQTGKSSTGTQGRGDSGSTPVMRCGVCDICSAVCCANMCVNCCCR